MEEETEPHSKQRKGPKMVREENPERTSSHEHTECTATYGRTSSEKKKASQRAERLLRSWQRRGGAHRMKLASLQQENAESVSPLKMSRNFSGYDNTVDRERELCVSNTGDAVSGKEHSTRRRHSPHLHTTNNMSQNQLKSNDPFRRKRARFLNW